MECLLEYSDLLQFHTHISLLGGFFRAVSRSSVKHEDICTIGNGTDLLHRFSRVYWFCSYSGSITEAQGYTWGVRPHRCRNWSAVSKVGSQLRAATRRVAGRFYLHEQSFTGLPDRSGCEHEITR
eukprot:9174374-Pyramimonas_sp.AAC.1